MSKIGVLLDSTSTIPKELAIQNDIEIVPLSVVFDDDVYLDGVEMTSDEFYSRLRSGELSSTSQPTTGQFVEKYEEMAKKYDEIIFISFSSKLSGTYQGSVLAKQMVEDNKNIKIHCFDSWNASGVVIDMGLEAAKMAKAGKTSDEILARLDVLRDNSKIVLMVEDLSHLVRLGRLSRAGSLIGSALKVKPVLEVVEGELIPAAKIRTSKKAWLKMIEMLKEEYNENTSISIVNADYDEGAEYVREKILEFAREDQIRIIPVTPVIGSHTGVDAIGVLWVNL